MSGLPAYLWPTLCGLAIGLVVGFERGFRDPVEGERERIAGTRTFGLVGMLGGLSAAVAAFQPALLVVAGAGVLALVTAGYVVDAWRFGRTGFTTELACLLTFGLAALAGFGHPLEGVGGAVAAALLLGLKSEIHAFVGRLTRQELLAVLQLLVVAAVALPLLPDAAMGPHRAINPRALGLIVLLIAGMSFAGYVGARLLGGHAGLLLTALIGALASSTAVTAAYARMAVRQPSARRLLAAGVMVAALVMALRVGIVVAVVRPSLLRELWPVLLLLAVPPAIGALLCLRGGLRGDAASEMPLSNPLELKAALLLTGALALMFVVVPAVRDLVGETGVLVVALLAGTTDVDAISVALARDAGLPAATAAAGIAVAAAANTLLKALLCAIASRGALAADAGAMLGITGLAVLMAALGLR
jgi:uncharacterized membrane protein (DUF4010 family)